MKPGNSSFLKIFIQSGDSSGTGLSSVLQSGGRPRTDLLSVLWGIEFFKSKEFFKINYVYICRCICSREFPIP